MKLSEKNRLHVVATKDTIKIEKDPSANLSLFPKTKNMKFIHPPEG